MDPKLRFLFFAAACVVFFIRAFIRVSPTKIGLVALGWLLFAIPFAADAAVEAW